MGASAYEAAVLADSPRVFYKLQDASGNPADSSGNGYNISSVTGTLDYHQTGPAADAYSIRFGAGEHADYTTGPVTTVTDNFTVECVVKAVTVSSSGRNLFDNGDTTGWGIIIDTDRKFRSVINGTGQGVASANAVSTTSFSHLVVHRSAGQWRYYFNGSLDTDGAAGGTPTTPTGNVKIGAGAGLDAYFAYCAVYQSALNATQIGQHYAALVETGQTLLPDADLAAGGWTTTPLYSKLADSSDATIITATAS